MDTLERTPRRTLRAQPLRRPLTLVAQVTEHVRRSIVEAEWRLGEYLSEERIASALGVSRTPVREALTALQTQGLVNIQPQRGTYVFCPTAGEVAGLCEFRMLMECQAVALCLARSKDTTLDHLRRANQAMHDAAGQKNVLAYSQADSMLHSTLFDHCGNQYIAEAYRLMASRFDALRNHLSSLSVRACPSPTDEHEQIIEAFSAGDLSRVQSLLSIHIFKMSDRYASALEAKSLP